MVFSLTGCAFLANTADIGIIGGADGPTEIFITEETETEEAVQDTEEFDEADETDIPEAAEDTDLAEDGYYYSAEDVALYIYTYGKLPDNFITKNEARDLGWEGGSVEEYAEGCAIGGDKFGNREGLLPKADGRVYYECDIDTNGENSRGAKRIVFSNDGLIYYTEDHYESFTLLYGEE
ncbi:MAG: ribonuclease [Ruminococcaceae bacterium]|nr:ribonuclease [Oscillospiraceae bacterium]